MISDFSCTSSPEEFEKATALSARFAYNNRKNSCFVQPIKNFNSFSVIIDIDNDVSRVDSVQLIHVHVVLLLNGAPSCNPLNLQSFFIHVEAQTFNSSHPVPLPLNTEGQFLGRIAKQMSFQRWEVADVKIHIIKCEIDGFLANAQYDGGVLMSRMWGLNKPVFPMHALALARNLHYSRLLWQSCIILNVPSSHHTKRMFNKEIREAFPGRSIQWETR